MANTHSSHLYRSVAQVINSVPTLFFLILLIACGAFRVSAQSDVIEQRLTEVPLPTVPDSLRIPQKRADFIIEHFWDSVSAPKYQTHGFSTYTREAVEQAFSNFISVFPIASENAHRLAFRNLVAKAENRPDDLAAIAEIAEFYLYTPDSPVESEDFYIIFLDELLKSPLLDDAARIRPQWQLESAMKNRPGDPATDFAFETRNGQQTSLYKEIERNSFPDCSYILIFYDPDCGHCRHVMDRIIIDERVNRAVAEGTIRVVAIYSGDDRELWDETATSLPAEWCVGYDDGTLQEESAYIIRDLPTIYLIASNKTVLKKEAKDLDL